VVIDVDVVVDRDSRELPLPVDEPRGGKRFQRRPIESLEEVAAALTVRPHRAVVEIVEELGDPLVQRADCEEGLVSEPGEDPALDDQHARFDLGLVPRTGGSRRQDCCPVVAGKLLVRPLDPGLVTTREGDRRLQLVGDYERGDAAEEFEGVDVARDEVRGPLRARRFGKRVVRRAEHGDEELHRGDLAGARIDDVRLLAGVVRERLLAGEMDLPAS
jgi:hypothetical protein